MANVNINYNDFRNELKKYFTWLKSNNHKPCEYLKLTVNKSNKIEPYGLTEKGIKHLGECFGYKN